MTIIYSDTILISEFQGHYFSDNFYTAGNDILMEGHFTWGDNPLTYSKWVDTNPSNTNGKENCIEMMWRYNFAWNDIDCNYKRRFICELSL